MLVLVLAAAMYHIYIVCAVSCVFCMFRYAVQCWDGKYTMYV